MSDGAAVTDDKKDERKNPTDKANYDEKVSVRRIVDGKFTKTVENVLAFRTVIDGKTVFYTMPRSDDAHAPKGSEIIDKDGVVWVTTASKATRAYHLNYVEKKKP